MLSSHFGLLFVFCRHAVVSEKEEAAAASAGASLLYGEMLPQGSFNEWPAQIFRLKANNCRCGEGNG
jgi:hypothetical protein